MFQLAIIPGKIVDLDSYMLPIVDEIKSLGKHGLVVKRYDGEVITSKVHLVMATGDIPQITKFIHHQGHRAVHGCRICSVKGEGSLRNPGSKYYADSDAPLRPSSDFTDGNAATQILGPSIFSLLPTFNGSSFFGLDEMHLLGQGMGRFLVELIVEVNKSPRNSHILHGVKDGASNMDGYTFKVDHQKLAAAGKMIEESRRKIPVSFQGSWDNLISRTSGARAIDFLDFLLYVVPTLIVPLFEDKNVRLALLKLVRGCAIALQWELTEGLIREMENCFAHWHNYLREEIKANKISVAVFRPNNHYLAHIGMITRRNGCMRVYSARSMERTIGRYSRLIKSTVFSGKNAGNIVERLATRSIVNFSMDINSLLDMLSSSSQYNLDHQLWSPFSSANLASDTHIESVPIATIIKELKKYYSRSSSSSLHSNTINISARALLNSRVYSSCMYRRIRREYRRGNHHVLFYISHNSSFCWYVGSVHFYFQHNNSSEGDDSQFLVLVEVMKKHTCAKYDPTMPVVTMNGPGQPPRYAVISLNDIKYQVGLVQKSTDSLEHNVVAPYYIFRDNIKATAGKLVNI
ncbi:hypothetical protein BDB01DRAFT_732242 [Pilobolus umbonatus]|nr:hypothetical protein BDB01DRAFT_732242 [Pilobolus umbonatus]